MKAKWVLAILLVGLFFGIGKGEDKVYCKDKDNEVFWIGSYGGMKLTINYYYSDGGYSHQASINDERIVYNNSWISMVNNEIWEAMREEVKKYLETKKQTLLENGECRYWGEE